MNIRNRIIEYRAVDAAELRPNPKNWRTHPKEQQDALRGILAEVGIADAVLARILPDGSLMLIDGHLRTETMPDQKIPVLVLDVTEAEADKLLATLDPLAAMAGKDAEQLAALLGTLKEQDDILSALVCPDYIIDPLLSADWTPPEPGEMPTHAAKESTAPEYEGAISAAIQKYREYADDDSLGDSQCLELICQEYLDR